MTRLVETVKRSRAAAPARLAAVVLLGALLVGCGQPQVGGPVEDQSPGRDASGAESAETTTVSGIFGGDPSLEGGCAWLDADDGTRYEVLYPDGWQVRFEPLELVHPDGEVVATEGDRLAVSGRVAEDRASVCMVGTMFEAEDVQPETSG